MAPFSASGTPRQGRRNTAPAGDASGSRSASASRHREDSAERFANIGRSATLGSGISFDTAFWQRVQNKFADGEKHSGEASVCPPPRPPRSVEPQRSPPQTGRSNRSEADWRQQQVEEILAAEAEDRSSIDRELEMRRRRAETVVGQWAEDGQPPAEASRPPRHSRGDKRATRQSEGMRQLEQQVADLRRRQAEQAHLLLAQEDSNRQQEERTLRLLQQQAEELEEQQQAERLFQQTEELRKLAAAELRKHGGKDASFQAWTSAGLPEQEDMRRERWQADNESSDEEELGLAEEEDEKEKMRWQSQSAGEEGWRNHHPREATEDESAEHEYAHADELEEEDIRRSQEAERPRWQSQLFEDSHHKKCSEKENVGPVPVGFVDEILPGCHAKSELEAQDRHQQVPQQSAGVWEQQDQYHQDSESWHQQAEEWMRRQPLDSEGEQSAPRRRGSHSESDQSDPRRWQEALNQEQCWQQAKEEERRKQRSRERGEDSRQQARQQARDDSRRQRYVKEAEEERRRQQLLQEMQMQREREEREWQEDLERERLELEREERRQQLERERQEYIERERLEERKQEYEREERRKQLERERQEYERELRRRQELEQQLEHEREMRRRQELEQQQEYEREERRRQELERDERRRQALEREQRRREELDRRRQDLEQETLRKMELEKEERRRHERAKGKEELLREQELRRQQQAFEENSKGQPQAFWDFEEAQRQRPETVGDPEKDDARPAPAQEPTHADASNAAQSHGEESERKAPDAPSANAAAEEAADPGPQTLYEVLKVAKDSTAEDIRKAYKRQCMRHHPDKGGDRDQFEQVGQAYQILSDKALRRAYDQRGMEGVEHVREKEKQKAKKDAAGQQEKATERAQPIVVEAYVPLEVAFSGGSVDVQVVRIAACAPCGGSGTAPGAVYMQCPSCDGSGGVPQYVQYGHMIVEQRAACSVCAGQGMVLPSTSLCAVCGGEQLVEEEVRVPFEIPPGVAEKERLVAKGQGHAMPGLAAGDVILVCRMQDHQQFFRKGDDLLAEHRVPLQVAICGGAFEVPLLNGHSIRVRLPRGCVLAPGSVKCVPGEGMPKRQNPHLRGDLVVRFGVDFPESLPEDTAARLASAFAGQDGPAPPSSPARGQVPPTPDREDGEVYLADFDMEQFGRSLHQESAKEAYEDEDEEERAKAAAMAAQAGRSHRHTFHGHGGYGYPTGFAGFAQPESGMPCRQM